ncbi:hypothetical protein O181_047815 [Austropuccinia psidii MF-1]|uniref:Uncharacterized protein n=1 Tax=Austropuccinia psidii MF-1 TaxID=1389203 RepID=A0A9Q3DW11_9BASI|nr:hypothetical protein [Austropuccinia psidii MF-1]
MIENELNTIESRMAMKEEQGDEETIYKGMVEFLGLTIMSCSLQKKSKMSVQPRIQFHHILARIALIWSHGSLLSIVRATNLLEISVSQTTLAILSRFQA